MISARWVFPRLYGGDLSIESRIIAVLDVFDALYSKRPYRDEFPKEKIWEIVPEDAAEGKLDMQVVPPFLNFSITMIRMIS